MSVSEAGLNFIKANDDDDDDDERSVKTMIGLTLSKSHEEVMLVRVVRGKLLQSRTTALAIWLNGSNAFLR
jgi:hypothetical protein